MSEPARDALPKFSCPACGAGESRVINSRPSSNGHEGIWRRRQCLTCQHRYTTEETIRGPHFHPSTSTHHNM